MDHDYRGGSGGFLGGIRSILEDFMLPPPGIEFLLEGEDSRLLVWAAGKSADGKSHSFFPALDCPNFSTQIGGNLPPRFQAAAPRSVGKSRVRWFIVHHAPRRYGKRAEFTRRTE